MKFISLQENLKKGLNIVKHISIKNINLPILNNILIKVNKNDINLISTNLEIGVVYKLRAKIDEVGETTINSKIIHDYISLIADEKILIFLENNNLFIESNNYKTKIKCEPSNEYPIIPEIKKDKYTLFNINDFKNTLNSVIFSTSINDNRPELSGVLFNFTEECLILAATDSYRLSECKINYQKNSFKNKKIIIPIKTIQELLRIINTLNNVNEIKLYISDNQILFNIDSVDLISRLISGNYPDYKQIIPNNFKTKITVNKNDLIRAIKASSLFTKTGINDILLFFNNEKTTISSSSSQSGESNINIKSKIEGENNEIKLDYRYLIDGLNNIESEEVVINIIDSQTPCLLNDLNNKNFLYIIMPIRD